jgi:leukotriene-A4 hydrolase
MTLGGNSRKTRQGSFHRIRIEETFENSLHRFLAAEEELVGMPYKFGVYDLLVLPPAFPYGGMVRSFISLTPDSDRHLGKCMFDVCHAKLVYAIYHALFLTRD